MQIKVVLYATLRDKLPREKKGVTMLELPEGSTIDTMLTKLDIDAMVKCSVNGEIARDNSRLLNDSDEVQVFRPIGGG
jgi:sulfur carrier protein ThiS